MRVTVKNLRKLRRDGEPPCDSHVERFAAEWPDGVEVTRAVLVRAAELWLDIDWWFVATFPDKKAEYDAKLKPIDDEYDAKLKPIYDEYDAKLKPIYDEYRAKRRPIDDEHWAKLKPIDDEHWAKRKPIDDEYRANIANLVADMLECE